MVSGVKERFARIFDRNVFFYITFGYVVGEKS